MAYPLTVVDAEAAAGRVARGCGGCTACCEVFPIPALGKGAWSRCAHQCGAGCGAYDYRPRECKEFECLYLSGHLAGDERRRPDNLGVVLYNTQSPLGTHLAATELRAGAADRPDARFLLSKLAQKLLVVVFKHADSGREVLGPPHLVAAARERFMRTAADSLVRSAAVT